MIRRIMTLAIWIAVGLSPATLPRIACAQAAAAQTAQEQSDSEPFQDDQSDKADKPETVKGHGRKVIRPGSVGKPVFVWRRGATKATLIALAGALVLALPVAAVYEFVSRKRTTLDRGVTQSILLLPPIVAGIVMVVQNSLALAFSLAGVATTVRFRSSLRDTNDASYIFLAIAIGIAAGAQALDVATVVSLGACAAALFVYGLSNVIHTKPVPVGTPPSTPAALPGQSPAPAALAAPEDDRHTVLVVSTPHDDKARSAVESLLDGLTKEWRLDTIESHDLKEDVRLRYSVRTKKRLDADALVSAINAAGASQGIRAEIDHGAAPSTAPSEPQPEPAPADDDDEAPETSEPATRS